MGISNLKFETEIFEFQQQPFRIPDRTPVETKADPYSIQQILTQLATVSLAVGQLHQVVTGQAFTRAAPVADVTGLGDEIRKLSERLDKLEGRDVKKA